MILASSFDTNDIKMWQNRGFMYGDGVFETMRCVNQKVPLCTWHQQRLLQSLKYLKIEPPDMEFIKHIIKEQLSEPDAVLRLTVFRRQAERGYQPLSRHCDWLLSQYPFQQKQRPLTLTIAKQRLSPQPLLKGMKHLNRLPQVLIARELNDNDADDLLVLNQQDEVIETTCQNLLIIKDNQVFTPDMQDCGVEGVALAWLKQHIIIKTQILRLNDIKNADGIITANAVHGFRQVKTIETLGSFQLNHLIYDRISKLWQQQINLI
ncbi:aminodeoxychorismate lyase [Marinicella gelatinilytica]|uniref:aminodeoxychorismate lyase n=1 Tax=Marinicella gelatinilytica TaxID=2996017 RepID=UPI002260A920|nr:aminodeoxychorismate lyase [Marinicella gelatinilytica]MCX7544636.1 aminodeoxychorismate lyase [Marinicella gelatinilytica]